MRSDSSTTTAEVTGALPSISVVIPARNIAEWLPAQLDSLCSQTYQGPLELVVAVDESSDDGTVEVVREWESRDRRVRSVGALPAGGIGQARNAGIQASSGDLILCCDGDDLADPGWVAGMAVAGDSYDLYGGRLDYSRLGRLSTSRREMQKDDLSVALGWKPWACGVSIGVWRRVFDELGGFNEDYRLCEDVEFSWRAIEHGFSIGFAPDAVMSYRQREDVRSSLRQAYRDGMWFPRLYRDFRSSGMPGPTPVEALRQWASVLLSLPRSLGSPDRRGRWIRVVVQMLGEIRGSIRYRVFWPA